MLLLTITLETGISLNIYIYSIFALIVVIGRSMSTMMDLLSQHLHSVVFIATGIYLTGTQVSRV